ncbi:hypothetical protein FA95DRAFT_1206422 [Auriscalpium vulgare]|uniref:Uncharacterized protein n=1 Tax=Auriscalpium vulgare TaxID=40419 RepID=A0ACB8RUP5_9AGAM|nr:hypothetical protein FA95DRAFT_1206422 [Auriscalpium vulgare]
MKRQFCSLVPTALPVQRRVHSRNASHSRRAHKKEKPAVGAGALGASTKRENKCGDCARRFAALANMRAAFLISHRRPWRTSSRMRGATPGMSSASHPLTDPGRHSAQDETGRQPPTRHDAKDGSGICRCY